VSMQSAMAEVRRVAQAHCPRCGDGPIPMLAAEAGTPHTCEVDITAARALALAAHDETLRQLGEEQCYRFELPTLRAEIELSDEANAARLDLAWAKRRLESLQRQRDRLDEEIQRVRRTQQACENVLAENALVDAPPFVR